MVQEEILIRRLEWPEVIAADPDAFFNREWLVTNGLGGYASGTVSGIVTRRYHGYLVAAMPVPLGRVMMFTHISERLRFPDGKTIQFFNEENFRRRPDRIEPGFLKEFRLEHGLPVWIYAYKDYLIEKRVFMPHGQNTVHIFYRLLRGDGNVRLKLRPAMSFRPHEDPVDTPLHKPYFLKAIEGKFEITGPRKAPVLRMLIAGDRKAFTVEEKRIEEVQYQTERTRGYASIGDLWSPGYFSVDLGKENYAALTASTESWEKCMCFGAMEALDAELQRREDLLQVASARIGFSEIPQELVLAADQFIIIPVGRTEDAARARAVGDEVRTVIAGYHWFTDWGRDTMISIEGLALLTGRELEAGYILRTFSHYIKNGLIPNMFPEGGREGRYNTADATLWYFHAIERYLDFTNDEATLRRLLPKFEEIIRHHIEGTMFGIRVDPRDSLLIQGEDGYALTWMDAKVGDWVVTPRRGKAVEINALWYNALRLIEKWISKIKGPEDALYYAGLAEKALASFNKRFWYSEGGYLYDVVDGENGDDASCRPNQLFAISLSNPVLDQTRWAPVIKVAEEKLLTPLGLRSLAPGSPDYKSIYFGDLRMRDAAYHQGTVWSWLIGPFVDAWLKVHPDERRTARKFLTKFIPELNEACIGSISEVFNAEPPFTPGGCIAQAWSVAEILRCWIKTADESA